MRLSSIVLVLQLILSSSAGAQIRPPQDELATPNGLLACRGWVAEPRDSASFRFDFRDISSDSVSRRSTFAYDALGNPLYASLRLTSGSDTLERLVLIAVRLSPLHEGARVLSVTRVTSTDSEPQSKVEKAVLDSTQLAQVEALGRWFWQRRCRLQRPEEGS